jgi:hypothetical protein
MIFFILGREDVIVRGCQLERKLKFYISALGKPDGFLVGSGDPSGSGMGRISDPWAGSWAEILANLLIGHGFVIGRPG